MSKQREKKYEPVTVPFAATPAGEPPSIRDWANPSVWTDRMLTTLEQGVRGGRWHTLIDKVYALLNLFAASANVIGNQGAAGVDHQTVEGFLARRRDELDRLHEALRTNRYRPQAVKRVWIEKLGSTEKRPLGVPTIRDRVVQTALLHVLETARPVRREGRPKPIGRPYPYPLLRPAEPPAGNFLRQEVPVAGVDHAPRATDPTSNHTNYHLSYHQYGYKSLPAAVENHFSRR